MTKLEKTALVFRCADNCTRCLSLRDAIRIAKHALFVSVEDARKEAQSLLIEAPREDIPRLARDLHQLLWNATQLEQLVEM